jgi:hypothetical protein
MLCVCPLFDLNELLIGQGAFLYLLIEIESHRLRGASIHIGIGCPI